MANRKKHYIVYLIENLLNAKIYVGFHSTDEIEDGYMGSGKLIRRAIEKYGVENFKRTVLFDFDNRHDAETMERRIVDEDFVEDPMTYNMTVGGNVCILFGERNGFYGRKHSDETKMNFSLNNPMHSPEIKMKVIEGIKRFYQTHGVSAETREKLRIAGTGRVQSEETKEKLRLALTGRIFTEEHKRKISISSIGCTRIRTAEHNKKISESLTGVAKPYMQIVNRNEDKIRKTAEKHRGMKRSDETKRNIKKSKEQFIYHTPYGIFSSAYDFEEETGLSSTLLYNRCSKEIILKPSSLNRAHDIPVDEKPNYWGKSWKEMGWFRETKPE